MTETEITRPPNLSGVGVRKWNKLTEWQKRYPQDYLGAHDFKSYDDYNNFEWESRISPFRERLLRGVCSFPDLALINNLCEILSEMDSKIAELEARKVDRDYD